MSGLRRKPLTPKSPNVAAAAPPKSRSPVRRRTLPARRLPATMASQRFAEICNLSDSEEEDLYPIDQPDPPAQPGMPAQRVKFSVDV